MNNPFENIISTELKQIYKYAIDEILSAHGLSIPCTLYYDKHTTDSFCSNCTIDPISQISSNIYNGTGPSPFPENTICPVCGGSGMVNGEKTEILYLGVLFDNKYFIKPINNAIINWPNNAIQTICSATLANKLRAAARMSISGTAAQYTSYEYIRQSDPQPIGFGDTNYVVTLWATQ
jgi:hypothetical protein